MHDQFSNWPQVVKNKQDRLQPYLCFMIYNFQLKDFPGAVFALKVSPWRGKPDLLMNGLPLQHVNETKGLVKKIYFLIPDGENEARKARYMLSPPTFLPALVINNVKHSVARKLLWYEYIIGCLPIGLLLGGAIGGGLGFIAVMLNFKQITQEKGSRAMNYLKTLGISAAAFLLYFFFYSLLKGLL